MGQSSPVNDLRELAARFAESWPDVGPIGHELGHDPTDRWVRVHSLPDSKRYPQTEEELAELVHRHNSTQASIRANPPDPIAQSPTRRPTSLLDERSRAN
jgi:hypothetical protein